uniref:ADP-ribosyl transferase 19-2 n=1 Tax=Miichthys miiuy TaxID=240162 RepID=A0AB39ACC8_MIIMI
MIDQDVAIEALGIICNASVSSVQRPHSAGMDSHVQRMSINNFISTMVDSEQTCKVSGLYFSRLLNMLQGSKQDDAAGDFAEAHMMDVSTRSRKLVIDKNEFFDPRFDYDFTNLQDTETYSRGGEVYERPCGWQRFGLKVLGKYDETTWLGTQYRSTQSVAGEWPVSYHGTSKAGADGIISGFYEPGPGAVYGRGIYSTPYIEEAYLYAKSFVSKKTGKTYRVILQNRINPKYREKHNCDKYWLVRIPKGTSDEEEQEMVERAIRPYGLLLKEIN